MGRGGSEGKGREEREGKDGKRDRMEWEGRKGDGRNREQKGSKDEGWADKGGEENVHLERRKPPKYVNMTKF